MPETEAMRLVFGADTPESGHLSLLGKRLTPRSPAKAIAHGIGYLPEDRKRHGVVLDLPIRTNLSLACLRKITGTMGTLKVKKEKCLATESVRSLRIVAESIERPVSSLSGGNQQKVSVAKWINTDSKIIILDEPTRGVDIGAKIEIYSIIRDLTARGIAIIMVSSEMEEIIGMSDRVLVMHDGTVSAILEKDLITEERILKLSIGKADSSDQHVLNGPIAQ